MEKVFIIGSGPAGLSAALAIAEEGLEPVILERMDRASAKLLVSGGGRCNFSNTMPYDGFMEKFGREGKFMRNALSSGSREWLLDFLKQNHVEPELTDNFYWFPASGRADDIQRAFLRCSHAEVRTSCEAVKIVVQDGKLAGIQLKNGEEIAVKTLIVAAGGCAWKGLGSGAGLRLAETAGHTIRKPLPAVAPLIVRESWPGTLAGVTLPNAALTLGSGRQKIQTSGSVLFTHNGLSGFPALDLAAGASLLCDLHGSAELRMCFRRDMNAEAWLNFFRNARKNYGQQSVKNLIAEKLPRSLAGIIVQEANCTETKICQLTTDSEKALPMLLTEYPLHVTGAGPMARAMAMHGGILLKEVEPSSMESKLVSGLFFAGEILDLVGPCGGYNIQWAISSGRLAGLSAARFLKDS